MIPLSEGEVRSVLTDCLALPGCYLAHSKVREICETALHYMRLAGISDHPEPEADLCGWRAEELERM